MIIRSPNVKKIENDLNLNRPIRKRQVKKEINLKRNLIHMIEKKSRVLNILKVVNVQNLMIKGQDLKKENQGPKKKGLDQKTKDPGLKMNGQSLEKIGQDLRIRGQDLKKKGQNPEKRSQNPRRDISQEIKDPNLENEGQNQGIRKTEDRGLDQGEGKVTKKNDLVDHDHIQNQDLINIQKNPDQEVEQKMNFSLINQSFLK